MIKALGSFILWIVGWFLDRKKDAGVEIGRAQQKVDDAASVGKQEERARNVEIDLDAASPAERERLRDKWTRKD